MALQIERSFTGEELVRRMKGWVTVDPQKVIEIVRRHGRLKVLDDRDLFVEMETMDDFERLQKDLGEAFGQEMNVDLVKKQG